MILGRADSISLLSVELLKTNSFKSLEDFVDMAINSSKTINYSLNLKVLFLNLKVLLLNLTETDISDEPFGI